MINTYNETRRAIIYLKLICLKKYAIMIKKRQLTKKKRINKVIKWKLFKFFFPKNIGLCIILNMIGLIFCIQSHNVSISYVSICMLCFKSTKLIL